MNRLSILALLILLVMSFSSLNAIEYEKNPYRSMVYSAVVPGGGQIYTKNYVKAGLIIGVQTYLISQALQNNSKMNKYKDLMDGTNSSSDLINRHQRDKYRDDLRSDYWWIGTTIFLSIADAFVDAHLYNFNAEKEKVHLKFEDKLLKLEYRF